MPVPQIQPREAGQVGQQRYAAPLQPKPICKLLHKLGLPDRTFKLPAAKLVGPFTVEAAVKSGKPTVRLTIRMWQLIRGLQSTAKIM